MRYLVLLVVLAGCTALNCSPSVSPVSVPTTDYTKLKIDGLMLSIKCKD